MENYIIFNITTTGTKPWHGHRVSSICAKDKVGFPFKEVLHKSRYTNEDEYRMLSRFHDYVSVREGSSFVITDKQMYQPPFMLTRMAILQQELPIHRSLKQSSSKLVKSTYYVFEDRPNLGDIVNDADLWRSGKYSELLQNNMDYVDGLYKACHDLIR